MSGAPEETHLDHPGRKETHSDTTRNRQNDPLPEQVVPQESDNLPVWNAKRGPTGTLAILSHICSFWFQSQDELGFVDRSCSCFYYVALNPTRHFHPFREAHVPRRSEPPRRVGRRPAKRVDGVDPAPRQKGRSFKQVHPY